MTEANNNMGERVAKLETSIQTVSEQYHDVLAKLDQVASLLKDNAVNQRDIQHLQMEQVAQWKKIDELKDATRKELEKVNTRIDHHMASCSGPGQAMQRADEALREAKVAQEEAKKAYDNATTANNLPGKYALAFIGTLLLLASNLCGGVLLYYITKGP